MDRLHPGSYGKDSPGRGRQPCHKDTRAGGGGGLGRALRGRRRRAKLLCTPLRPWRFLKSPHPRKACLTRVLGGAQGHLHRTFPLGSPRSMQGSQGNHTYLYINSLHFLVTLVASVSAGSVPR